MNPTQIAGVEIVVALACWNLRVHDICLSGASSSCGGGRRVLPHRCGLRGGYDTNPQFSNGIGIGGSAFIGTDTALAAATREQGYSLGVAAEAGTTQYANPLASPTLTGKVILRGMIGDDEANLSSVMTVADVNSYDLRSSDLVQSIRGEVKFGSVKLFTTVEGARTSLNQTNAIFQDFLPDPQQYLRGTVIPGISVTSGKFEIGTSVNLSVRRYAQEFDDFGYRRDNERVQPFLFAKYSDKDFTASGSISQLRGTWHDVDFTNVNATLFEGNVNWRIHSVTIDLSASRRANETTFPISPITLDEIYTGKISWQVDPRLTLSSAVGYYVSQYLDSPFISRIVTYGIGVSHDLGNGLDLTRAQGTLISGEECCRLCCHDVFDQTLFAICERQGHGKAKSRRQQKLVRTGIAPRPPSCSGRSVAAATAAAEQAATKQSALAEHGTKNAALAGGHTRVDDERAPAVEQAKNAALSGQDVGCDAEALALCESRSTHKRRCDNGQTQNLLHDVSPLLCARCCAHSGN